MSSVSKIQTDETNLAIKDEKTNGDGDVTSLCGDTGVLIPPLNFEHVTSHIFRSGYPNSKNFSFMKKKNIRCVIYLGPKIKKKEELIFFEQNLSFYAKNGIRFEHCACGENREPFRQMNYQEVEKAIKIALNPDNQPVLLHCLKGKSQSGCVAGCIRKIQRWPLSSILHEYKRVVRDASPLDISFIEFFDPKGFKLPPG